MNKIIQLIEFIDIRYADPISAMDLTNDYLLFGTMLGATKYYNINQKKLIRLSDVQDEFISGVKIYQNNFYICIGDVKINQYNIDNEQEMRTADIETDNYQDEDDHKKKCDNCLTMLNNNYLIRTYINFPDKKDKEKEGDQEDKNDGLTEFSIKNIIDNNNDNEVVRKIKMSNYSVPFDFDGKNYIFIDFISENNRTFNVYEITEDPNLQEMKISFGIEQFNNEKIGHISHLKIIKDDLLFIVRDYNICEIRNFQFEIKKQLNIKASEILAFELLYNDNNNDNDKENDKEDDNENNINNGNDKNEENENEENNDNKDKEKELLYIILLDLDYNLYLYNYKEDKNELLLNLDKDDINIDKDIRGQGFFLFNYPYYIKMTNKYIAISTDYGCILLQYNSS